MSTKANIENQRGYDTWSSFYDRYPNPTVAVDQANFSKAYSDLADSKVLEIGCGTGRHTAQLVSLGNHVTGLDISEGMLAKARQKVATSDATLIHGDFMDVEKLPNQPFDAAVMSLVLEHISSLEDFFQKLRRFLRSGTPFYLSEIHPDRASEGVLAHFKDENGEERFLSSRVHLESEIRDAAEGKDFEIQEVQTVLGDRHLTSLNPKWAKYVEQPMIQIWKMKSH